MLEMMGKEILARIFQPTGSEELPDGSILVQRREIFDEWSRIRNEWILIKDNKATSFKFHHTLYSGQELKDRLLQAGFSNIKLFGNLPMTEALGVANTTVGKFVKGITETITTASLINLDYADMRSVMAGAGIASIGIGEGKGESKVEQAAERALNGRLLDIEDVTKARGMLIHVSGGEDMTLEEVHHAGEFMKRSIPPKAKIIWGARVNKGLEGTASVMAVLTGVESAFLTKRQKHLGPVKLPF